ncbi:MAG: ESPR-type extended signal peptide-containing protein [Limnobaculum xujianqingii]
MNTIYRLVWSDTLNAMVVAPETTKGRKKGSGRTTLKTALILALSLFPFISHSATINQSWIGNYTFPAQSPDQQFQTGVHFNIDGIDQNDNTANDQHYLAGTVLNIVGPIPVLEAGSNGNVINATLKDLLLQGRIKTIQALSSSQQAEQITADNIDSFFYSTSAGQPQQNQEVNVTIPGLEGSQSVLKVYDSSTFGTNTSEQVGAIQLPTYDPSSIKIYNNLGIARIAPVGGTVNVYLGADTNSNTAISDASNTISLLSKHTTLAAAEGTGSATSDVNWYSDNRINFAPAIVLPSDTQTGTVSSTKYSQEISVPAYGLDASGEVVRLADKTFTIQSAADIATLNDWLIRDDGTTPSQVQLWLDGEVTSSDGKVINSAKTAQDAYNSLILSVLALRETDRVDWEYHIWQDGLAHSNNGTLDTGELNVILATGSNASGIITSEGSLAVSGASSVMHAKDNATLINQGALNAWRESGNSPQSDGMLAEDSSATNLGTINAGLFIEKNGTNQNVNNNGSYAMHGKGNSTLTNSSLINAALTNGDSDGAAGMVAEGNTQATNDGRINLVSNSHNARGKASGYGADISGSSTFVNSASGEIYVGTQAQTSMTDSYSDVNMIGGASQAAGVRTSSSGNVTNDGTIILGSKVRNAVGMLVNGASGLVINNGRIEVLGTKVLGYVAQNFGLSAIDTTTVRNNGDIYVNGDNNVALNVLANKANADVQSLGGTITVDGSGDINYRNFAVFVEGDNSYRATANIASQIILNAKGAVGVHARGNALINVQPSATIQFNGENQIGYYAYGPQAEIDLATATLGDNGQAGTILFAIDHGASFTGSSTGSLANPYNLTVSGVGSVAVHTNGRDGSTASKLLTGDAQIHVKGEQAVGVKVTGGAQGVISDGAILLENNNTTAVVVDGRDYKINGNISTTTLPTIVDSHADISTQSSQSGIKGYDVSYNGQLILGNDSGMQLGGSDNIGVYLHNGGIATNNSDIAVEGDNNLGVYIQNQGQLTNRGTISVSRSAGSTGPSSSVGVKVEGSGAVVNKLGVVTANGGLAAVQLINGATLTINGNDNRVDATDGAHGILMDTGAVSLTAQNTTINVSGSGAGIQNNANSSNIKLNNVTINAADGPAIRTAVTFTADDSNANTGNVLNVMGDDSNFSGAGFAFENEDGSNTTGDLHIGSGYTINVDNATHTATGDAIRARTDGSVDTQANIYVDAAGGAAIYAPIALGSISNGGVINSFSEGSNIVQAALAGAFTNTGSITAGSTTSQMDVIDISGAGTGSRTILNDTNASIIANSQQATLINAGGSANNTITNKGTLQAVSDTALAIQSGSGNDVITLDGGATRGVINADSGQDRFVWNSGTFAGEVNFSGADGGDSAQLGNVDLFATRHLLSEGGTDSQLTLTDTHLWNGAGPSAKIGSLTTDDLAKATNIGTGWNSLAVSGSQADVRIVDNLALSGTTPTISVTNGATLRAADNISDATKATLNNYDVATSGSTSKVVLDGTSATQVYSGVISGDGQLERGATGTTILLGENTYTGNTLIDATGALQIGDGGTSGSLSEATSIIDNGLFTIDLSKELTLSGAIVGTGAFHQIGSGLTRLNGNNSYQAETRVC